MSSSEDRYPGAAPSSARASARSAVERVGPSAESAATTHWSTVSGDSGGVAAAAPPPWGVGGPGGTWWVTSIGGWGGDEWGGEGGNME